MQCRQIAFASERRYNDGTPRVAGCVAFDEVDNHFSIGVVVRVGENDVRLGEAVEGGKHVAASFLNRRGIESGGMEGYKQCARCYVQPD